jgi:hypothetical protein
MADCTCLGGSFDKQNFEATSLGADSRGATAAVLKCKSCGQRWLRYFHREEAMADSDRWWMGAITSETAAKVSAETAAKELSRLATYWRGGGYYGSTGKTKGEISLT